MRRTHQLTLRRAYDLLSVRRLDDARMVPVEDRGGGGAADGYTAMIEQFRQPTGV
jgi:hypothetical protein